MAWKFSEFYRVPCFANYPNYLSKLLFSAVRIHHKHAKLEKIYNSLLRLASIAV